MGLRTRTFGFLSTVLYLINDMSQSFHLEDTGPRTLADLGVLHVFMLAPFLINACQGAQHSCQGPVESSRIRQWLLLRVHRSLLVPLRRHVKSL